MLYNSVNSRLDYIALLLARRIQDEGFSAFPIPAFQIIDSERLGVVIYHKPAASPAGLGGIGRSCLSITLDYGLRVRFATILTDARLDAGSPIDERCGDCREFGEGVCGLCVYICPYGRSAKHKPSILRLIQQQVCHTSLINNPRSNILLDGYR